MRVNKSSKIFLLQKQLDHIEHRNNNINFSYEPRILSNKTTSRLKRHVYFDDLRKDFIDELSLFGFTPFIPRTFQEQQTDPGIKQFKKKIFNYGFNNYVIKTNKRTHSFNTPSKPQSTQLELKPTTSYEIKNLFLKQQQNLKRHYMYSHRNNTTLNKRICLLPKCKGASVSNNNRNKRVQDKPKLIHVSNMDSSISSLIEENNKIDNEWNCVNDCNLSLKEQVMLKFFTKKEQSSNNNNNKQPKVAIAKVEFVSPQKKEEMRNKYLKQIELS
jgi:hypothetical protein